MGIRNIGLIISLDIKNFLMYRCWIISLIAMNLTDLVIFAVIFTNLVPIDYLRFFAPGLVVISLFASAFSIGREVNWEIRSGLNDYLLSLPFRRLEIVLARMISGGIRGLMYSFPFILLSLVLSKLPSLTELIIIISMLFPLAAGIAGLSIGTAAIFKRFEAYIMFRSILYFALYFASSVFYPLEVIKRAFPVFVYLLAKYNPLSNGADLLRSILIGQPIFTFEMVSNILIFSFFFTMFGLLLYFLALIKGR